MPAPSTEEDRTFQVDILGQQPSLQLYTQICFCFPVADFSLHPTIIKTLASGLERLCASFPWLAGKVVNEGSASDNSGTFKIKSFEKFPRSTVKYLQPSISMDGLRRADFPFSMLDETDIAPCKTIPKTSKDLVADSALVFLLQANFIDGGLILTFNGQHQAMDMTGLGQIIHLFSIACREEPFTDEERSSGNFGRNSLTPLLGDSYELGPELTHQLVTPKPSATGPKDDNDDSAPTCAWTYFAFSAASLTELKSVAMKTVTSPPDYISTDDALTAFLWRSITRARTRRLSLLAKPTLARAVDARQYVGIPDMFPGMMMNMTYHTCTKEQIIFHPLGEIASQLRLAVDPETSDLGKNTRALATFLNRTPDKNTVNFVASIDPGRDIMLSSWAKLNCYDLDFGLGLGKPEAVRRPRFEPVESLIYLMPKTLDGEIAVAVCLRNEDLGRLRADAEFAKYARHIG